MTDDVVLRPLFDLGAGVILERKDREVGGVADPTLFVLKVNWRRDRERQRPWDANLVIRGRDLDNLVARAMQIVRADTGETGEKQ